MQVNVTGRHVTITDELENHVREKFSKLERFYPNISHTDVVLSLEGHGTTKNCIAEATVVLGRGVRLHGRGEAPDEMGVAIDAAESRLQKQVRRFHAKLTAHRDRDSAASSSEPVEEEEEATYEEIVRQMLEEDAQ